MDLVKIKKVILWPHYHYSITTKYSKTLYKQDEKSGVQLLELLQVRG